MFRQNIFKKLFIFFGVFVLSLFLLVFFSPFKGNAQSSQQWVDLTGQSCTYAQHSTSLGLPEGCRCDSIRFVAETIVGKYSLKCRSNYSDLFWCDPVRDTCVEDVNTDWLEFSYGLSCESETVGGRIEDCSFWSHLGWNPSVSSPTDNQLALLGQSCIYRRRYEDEYFYTCREPVVDLDDTDDTNCSDVNLRINGLPGQRIRVRGNLCSDSD